MNRDAAAESPLVGAGVGVALVVDVVVVFDLFIPVHSTKSEVLITCAFEPQSINTSTPQHLRASQLLHFRASINFKALEVPSE